VRSWALGSVVNCETVVYFPLEIASRIKDFVCGLFLQGLALVFSGLPFSELQ
jgi:hypothetical protein